MAGWDSFYEAAGKFGDLAYGKKPGAEPVIDTASEPPLVEPASAQQEQQVANQMAAQLPSQPAPQTPTPMQAAPQQPMPQPSMVPIQQTVSGISLPPKLLAKQDQIEQKALAAQDALTNAQIQQNTLLAEQAKAQATEIAAANQRAATQAAYDAEQQQAKQAELQKAVDDYNNNKTINPNRAYERMGVGGRILATIGQAFGAFGAAITHSPNFAQQMIERAIDADIKAQESDIAARGHAVNMANNTVANFRQKGLDNQASMAAARLQMLQASSAKVDEILASTKNAPTIAIGQQLKAGLEKSYNDTLMHYGQQQVSTTKQNAAIGMSPGAQLPAKQAEDLGTANAAIQAAEDLKKAWEKDGSGVINAISSVSPYSDAAAFRAQRTQAKQIIGSYLENGVLRKEDEGKYDKFLPDIGDSNKIADRKHNSLIALISQRATAQKKAQRQAGFNVNGIEITKPVTTFKPVE